MLATLLVVAGFAAAGDLAFVIAPGGRWRRDGVLAALTLARERRGGRRAGRGGRGGGVWSPLLAALGAWQGMGYAAAPIMAWLNRHADLSAKLRRRQRSEERRERLAPYEAGLARVAAVLVVAGCLAVVVLIARYPGDGTSAELPDRPADDTGPLANMGGAPGIGADADEPATPVPGEGTPVAGGTPAGDGAEGDADGTSSTVAATTTTLARRTTVPPATAHTTPGATRPTRPERPSPGGGPPTTRSGR